MHHGVTQLVLYCMYHVMCVRVWRLRRRVGSRAFTPPCVALLLDVVVPCAVLTGALPHRRT